MNFNRWKNIGLLTVIVATLFLAGCNPSDPASSQSGDDSALATQLDNANRLMFNGQLEKAIKSLEALHQQHPKNAEIVESLGFAYAKASDYALAGFYFDQVLANDPTRTDIALYAGRAYMSVQSWDFAANNYQTYLKANPNDFIAWKDLATIRMEQKQAKPALDAYLNAFSKSDQSPSAQEYANVASLYLKLGNEQQAARWFNDALNAQPNQPETQQQCLLGLLQIEWQRKNWQNSEKIIGMLDKLFPTALDESPLAYTRQELADFKKAQEELKQQKILAAAKAKEEEEQKKKAEAEAQAALAAENSQKEETNPAETIASNSSDSKNETEAPETTSTSAEEVASEESESDSDLVETASYTKYPPNLVEKETPLEMEDAVATEESTSSTKKDLLADGSIVVDKLKNRDIEPLDSIEEVPEPEPEPTLFEIAKNYQKAGDHKSAIGLFQSILIDSPESGDICHELSRSYYLLEDWSAAELYAAEAMRCEPDNIVYAIHFLKTVQKGKNSDRLIKELIRAKEKFPDSPEITIALAQGYERILKNNRNARILYEEFLTLADTTHPKRAEAEKALNQLRIMN